MVKSEIMVQSLTHNANFKVQSLILTAASKAECQEFDPPHSLSPESKTIDSRMRLQVIYHAYSFYLFGVARVGVKGWILCSVA